MTNYFENDNFGCRCGKCAGDQDIDPGVRSRLNLARHYAGVPFVLTSAYRCKLHPQWSENHEGWAVDIKASDSRMRFKVLSGLLKAGFTRVGVSFDGGFIHADQTPGKPAEVLWGY